MTALTYVASRSERWTKSGAGFLVAWRNVPWPLAAPSIAASWIWAPALFVSIQKSYELGLPGIFWFTAPNIAAVMIFAFLAPKIRDTIPGGYTLPDWIRFRLGSELVHRIYMIPFIWYQIMAVCVQIFVGGLMLNYLTGIPINILMILLLITCLAYSLISGLRASIVTDLMQMVLIIAGCIIMPLWVLHIAGWDILAGGLGGKAGKYDIFDGEVAFSFGIVTVIGLLAGAISDQQFWQRAFAIKRSDLVPAYITAGIMFGIVPILLSILGFIAANPAAGIAAPEGMNLPMIGIETVTTMLPIGAAVFFVIMLLCGLMSTLDSAMCAASSLYAIDIAPMSDEEREVLRKERIGKELTGMEKSVKDKLDLKITHRARIGMYAISILGLITAIIVQHLFSLDRLWWIFNGVGVCFVIPTVLSLYYPYLSAHGVMLGIIAAAMGLIPFVYGNWVKNDVITVASALYMIGISLFFCFTFKRSTPWQITN